MLLSQSLYAQEAPKTSTFHRLLLLNEKNELMVVKIKNSNRWVTPGWYQDDRLTIAQGLDELAAGYGVKIATPKLRARRYTQVLTVERLAEKAVYIQ
ncbi:hypothetical protein CSQ96_27910 [Janthinobacterium sp. BJB412]|nr:hypothetical protein CSQ96_27910 [Janthinobacterium sp. BJB412]